MLGEHGRRPGEVLGSGMEGTVVDLSDDEVAKIWHHRTVDELRAVSRFGAALGRAHLPFGTSRATHVLSGNSVAITIERKVPGEPLRRDFESAPPVVDEAGARLMGDALAGLARATSPALAVLPILPGEGAFDPGRSFPDSLADLTERRFAVTGEPLRRDLDDAEGLVERIVTGLRALQPSSPTGLLHGDLIPANVMIERGEVSGIVDFGFLTTVGDPHFDAAITASIFDMYGPHARQSEDILTGKFADRFGHDRTRYGLYRAAYAVITCAYYAPDGNDGHFAWCAAMLRRPDVLAAIPA